MKIQQSLCTLGGWSSHVIHPNDDMDSRYHRTWEEFENTLCCAQTVLQSCTKYYEVVEVANNENLFCTVGSCQEQGPGSIFRTNSSRTCCKGCA